LVHGVGQIKPETRKAVHELTHELRSLAGIIQDAVDRLPIFTALVEGGLGGHLSGLQLLVEESLLRLEVGVEAAHVLVDNR
jgi:hypothetical protein